MTGSTTTIDPEIDLRSSWEGVRDQLERPTCLACAASDAHAHFHKTPPLSVEYLFYQSVQRSTDKDPTLGLTFAEVAEALAKDGQPIESEWPYSPSQPDPWMPPSISDRWYGTIVKDKANAVHAVTDQLRAGKPVVLGIRLTSAFLAPTLDDFTIPATGPAFGGHAVLAVGLGASDDGESFFLIRNSWGEAWADRGHAWLASDYLLDHLVGFSCVTELLKVRTTS